MRLGWHSRGYLPHFEAGERPQFVTWRLADSLPREVLNQWIKEVSGLPESARKREILKRTGAFLDTGTGQCLLRIPHFALIVQDVLMQGHGRMYCLHCWVIMPNHVHVILSPVRGVELGKIVKQIKGSSARAINLERGATGALWHPDYLDKLIRDEKAFDKIRLYIEWNPVRAGLCYEPGRWPYSSASERAHSLLTNAASTEEAKD